jgi:hypothetical protein
VYEGESKERVEEGKECEVSVSEEKRKTRRSTHTAQLFEL